jgi:predicted RNA-binding Zn-ribbon protein involved in translation (DUF1610 family)
MGIDSRLRRLEERGGGSVCPECGFGETEGRPYVLIDELNPERSFKGDPYETCASCGQPLHVVIRVVRDSSAGEEGGGGDTYWPNAQA